jgi:hypothetical protein
VDVNVPDEAAQLVIGAALIDRQFAQLLLDDPAAALMQVESVPGAPRHLRLTDEDRRRLAAERMPSLEAFAGAVESRRQVSWSDVNVRRAPRQPDAADRRVNPINPVGLASEAVG